MADQPCPVCGKNLPDELGQHADNLEVGLVTCPHCGAGVTLRKEGPDSVGTDFTRAAAAPPGRTEGRETFSANETFGELREEYEQKS